MVCDHLIKFNLLRAREKKNHILVSPCGQVSVNKIDDFQVLHSGCNLSGHVNETAITEKCKQFA